MIRLLRLRYWFLGGLIGLLVLLAVQGPAWWRNWKDAEIVSDGGRLTAVVQAVEPADEDNPSGSRWRYTLLVQPPDAAPYRATTEIDGFLVPGDTVVNVAVDPDNPQVVVIIP
jgi:hypothetical protein